MKLNPLTPDKITAFIRRTLHPSNQMIHLVGASSEIYWKLTDSLNTNGFQQTGVDKLKPNTINIIFYFPPRFTANNIIFNQIRDLKTALRPNGQFHMITTKSTGGMQFAKMVQEIFGGEVTMEVGNGGLRLVSTTKVNDELPTPREVKHQVSFDFEGHHFQFETLASNFSATELDEGAKLLLKSALSQIKKAHQILDVGCGWGPIGLVTAILNPQAQVILLDTDPAALKSATTNRDKLKLNPKQIQVQDKLTINQTFDLVLTNPPFHNSDESLLELFYEVKTHITPKGTLLAAIEKTYISKFEKIFNQVFGNAAIHTQLTNNFVVLEIKNH